MSRIRTLADLLALVSENPELAKQLKADPSTIAKIFGVDLSQEEVDKIRANLDVNAIVARQTDSMAAKVAQGIGLQNLSSF